LNIIENIKKELNNYTSKKEEKNYDLKNAGKIIIEDDDLNLKNEEKMKTNNSVKQEYIERKIETNHINNKKDKRKSKHVKKQIILIEDNSEIEPMNAKRTFEPLNNSEEIIRKQVFTNQTNMTTCQPQIKENEKYQVNESGSFF